MSAVFMISLHIVLEKKKQKIKKKVVLLSALLYPEIKKAIGLEMMKGYLRDAKVAHKLLQDSLLVNVGNTPINVEEEKKDDQKQADDEQQQVVGNSSPSLSPPLPPPPPPSSLPPKTPAMHATNMDAISSVEWVLGDFLDENVFTSTWQQADVVLSLFICCCLLLYLCYFL
jgi:hypothetical protein